jgi:hypothetical protein
MFNFYTELRPQELTMPTPNKNHHLDAILAGTDGHFAWSLHPLREQAIKLKQSRVTTKERQFLLDVFAAFDADYPLDRLAETTVELSTDQRRVALQCVRKGLGSLDGLEFSLSTLGASWLTINYPELAFETMSMVPAYKAGRVQPSAPL